jgi:MFS family permease
VVFLGFTTIITYGLFFSYSVFLEPLEAELHSSRAAISAVYTIYMVVYGICAIPMGLLSDKYGPQKTLWLAALLIGSGISLCSLATSVWQLYLFFGVIAALGHGAIFVVPASTTNRWFIQKRGLAVGIIISGLGVGLLVVPPITAQIIDIYGWRVAFTVLGTTFFIINAIAGLFIRGRPEDKGLRPLGEVEQEFSASGYSPDSKDFAVTQVLKTKVFWMLYLVSFFCFGAEQMVLVHIVPYSTTIGISSITASLGISFLGVGTIIGRVVSGAVSDKIGRVFTLTLCCALEAAGILYLLLVDRPATLYFTMFFLGIGYGGWVVLGSVMLREFFGSKYLGAIIGVWFSSGAPAGILGPLMAGIIFDFTKSYFLAFLIAGTICAGAVILAILIKPHQKRLLSSGN